MNGGHSAVPSAGVWEALSRAIMGAHHGSIAEFRSGADLPENSRPEWFSVMARSVEFMAFRCISRRIAHRPMTDADVDAVTGELHPRILALGDVPVGEIRDAICLALGRPPSAGFNRSDPDAVRRVIGYWTALVGVQISDAAELESMRPEVGRWLEART